MKSQLPPTLFRAAALAILTLPTLLAAAPVFAQQTVTLQITAPNAELTEGTAANFTISFMESVTTTEAITFSWVNNPGVTDSADTAAAADFGQASLTGNATIPAGMSSVTIAITASDDAVSEGPETFTVIISSPAGGGADVGSGLTVSSTAGTAQATIAASDPVTVRLVRRAGQTGDVIEGGYAEFTASLVLTGSLTTAATAANPICVTFQTEVGNQQTPANDAASGADLEVRDCAGEEVAVAAANGQATAGGVLIPAGGMGSARLRVLARYDGIDEGLTDEELTVAITSAAFQPALTGATTPAIDGNNQRVTVNIQNTNPLRTIAASTPMAMVMEDHAAHLFQITLAGNPPVRPVTVRWAVTDAENNPVATVTGGGRNVAEHGGAHGPSDFTGPASGSVTFGVGDTAAKEVIVRARDDAYNEGAETLTVTLTDPCPASGACEVGGRTATDPQAAPALAVSRATSTVQIAASDPIAISIADGPAAIVAGEDAPYTLHFGCANGESGAGCTEVIPTTDLTIPLTVTVGGSAVTVPGRTLPRGSRTFTLTAAEINAGGMNHGSTLSVTLGTPTNLPGGATAAVATGAAATTTEVAGWTVALSAGRLSGSEGAEFVFTFTLAGDPAELANGFMVPWAIAGSGIDVADFAPGDALSGNVEFTATAAATRTVSVTTARNDDGNSASETFTFTIGALSGGDAARADIVDEDASGMRALTVTVNEDDPAARQARMKTITAAMARGMAAVADSMISRRFTAVRAGSGQAALTIGGQTVTEAAAGDFAAARGDWAANPFERGRMLAQTRANTGGNAMAMSEILHASSFNLSGVGGGSANMWGAAETVNFDDKSGPAAYDGGSTSAHFGIDQRCGDDCVRGLSVSWTGGDVGFDDTVAGVSGTVESNITGLHPYLARWLSDDMFWWVTGGYGLGDVKIRETDNTFDTAIGVRMLGGGISGAARAGESTDFVLRMRAQWTHTTLAAALADAGSARLPKTTSTTLRLGGEWEAGRTWDYTGGLFRLHGNLGARRDFRDAKDDIAYDAGAGARWTGDDGYTIGVGLTTQISGPAAKENRYNAEASWQKSLRGFGFSPHVRLDLGRHGPADWNGGLRLAAPAERLNFTLETSRAGRSALSGELRF